MMYWLLGGIGIIVILATIAAYYLWQLYRLKRLNAARWDELQAASLEQRQRINNSIQILAGAIGKDEITLTEASIRICGLLDSLQVPETTVKEYKAFYHLRAATDHIPFLDKWRALSRQAQFNFDQERQKIEREHRAMVEDAAVRIRGRIF